jgi:SP family arabinose:H+ symporter-like MFS transporter
MAVSIATIANWGSNYVTSSLFLTVTSGPLGKVFAYIILALSCLIVFFFTLRFVPETLNKTNEECIRLVAQSKNGIFTADEKGLLDNNED